MQQWCTGMLVTPLHYCWCWWVTRFHYLAWSQASAEYWKHFIVPFNGVHVFGYNSARSEPIWMKFGALWVHCLPLAQVDFGHDPCRSKRVRQKNFCQVSNMRFHGLPVGQISQNLHERHGSVRWILSEQNFENFPTRGLFSKKANFSPKSSMTCDFRPL